MSATVTIPRETLRKMGGCAAVSYDGMHCQLRYGHARSHMTRSGSTCFWPDSERDPKRSDEEEARIWVSLLNGHTYSEPHDCGGYCDD